MSSTSASLTSELNERTPLITRSQAQRRTPLPTSQIVALLFVQLSEPVTSQAIYPFINELIKELDITGGDERKAGYYAGLLESLFFACEALTVLFWSRLSDSVGRRPILLVGFTGLSISMICFGLSRTFPWLGYSRCLAGLLNGYSGVIKSMMGEITDSSNMAQAFAYIPAVWSVGAMLGPFIGGQLSHPAERFPWAFTRSPFWKEYPLFLPCLVAALFPMASSIVVFLFLQEPPHLNERQVHQVDNSGGHSVPLSLENQYIVIDEVEVVLLTRPVLVAVLNYALLSLIDIAFVSVEPLFYATSIRLGGLGLSPPTIGSLLGLYGLTMGIFQLLSFEKFHDWLGAKTLLILTLFANAPIYMLFPMINLFARTYVLSSLTWVALCFQYCLCVFSDMSEGCAFIFVTLAAPNKRSLGAVNGLVAAVTATIHAIGPATATSLFAASIEYNLLNGLLVYIVAIGVVILALMTASLLRDKIVESNSDADADC
ncbi:hypothetical protein ACEPAG_7467 [Sanghuangporus baumii]